MRRPGSPDRSYTLHVLRAAVLVACLGVGVAIMAALLADPNLTGPGRTASAAAVSVCLILFAIGSWRNLSRPAGRRLRPETVTWLALQTLMGAFLSSDLMIMVSITVPLALPFRLAVAWFVVQSIVLVASASRIIGTPDFVVDGALRQVPYFWQVVISIGQVLGWNVLAFAGGLLAATEIRAHRELRRLNAELLATGELLSQTSRLAERAHIARELHDTFGHRLAALGVSLELAARRSTGDAAATLQEARGTVRDLLVEVRDVVGDLRSERSVDLKRALARLLEETAGLEVEFTLSPGLDVREPAQAHALFRCAQESLTNILRHAEATRAWLDLRQDAAGVSLRIRDDGRGSAALDEGHGLRGMRERLEGLGGTLTLGKAPEGGLELLAWVPCRADPS